MAPEGKCNESHVVTKVFATFVLNWIWETSWCVPICPGEGNLEVSVFIISFECVYQLAIGFPRHEFSLVKGYLDNRTGAFTILYVRRGNKLDKSC